MGSGQAAWARGRRGEGAAERPMSMLGRRLRRSRPDRPSLWHGRRGVSTGQQFVHDIGTVHEEAVRVLVGLTQDGHRRLAYLIAGAGPLDERSYREGHGV